MSLDFDLEIQRKNGSYIFVARQFGVVVRDNDIGSGAREAETRIMAVTAESRDDVIVNPGSTATTTRAQALSRSRPLLIGLTAFGVGLFAFLWIAGSMTNVTGHFGAIFRRASDRLSPFINNVLDIPNLGLEIATITVPSTSDAGTPSVWLTKGPARVDADGTATGGSDSQIYQFFSVPVSATTVYGKLTTTSNIWNGTTILDVIWYEDQREISRVAESWRSVKDRPVETEFIYAIPPSANRLQLIARTWRPQDGLVKVLKAKVSWYHPDASAKVPVHWFNIR